MEPQEDTMPWGIAMIVIGGLMALGGATQSDFVVYRLLAARSRLLWGERGHAFFIVAGMLVAVAGVLMLVAV